MMDTTRAEAGHRCSYAHGALATNIDGDIGRTRYGTANHSAGGANAVGGLVLHAAG